MNDNIRGSWEKFEKGKKIKGQTIQDMIIADGS